MNNVFSYHIDKINETNFKADDNGNRVFNASRLESLSLLTLVTYIKQKNSGTNCVLEGESFTGLDSHTAYLSKLITELRARHNFIREVSEGNAFKSGYSLVPLARAWDLYLALENAYEDFGGDVSLLLNASDKQFWNNEIYRGMKTLWQQTHSDINLTEWLNAGITGVQNHEAQAGNWPLISHVTNGIAALGYNGSFVSFSDDDGVTVSNPGVVYQRALKSVDLQYWDLDNKRYNYFFYQTGEGKEYWSEGPYYFEVMAPHLFDFLHVQRANRIDLTESNTSYSLVDNNPFDNPKFYNVLDWHYSIATPDGNTPPLDDGNKKSILSAGRLSWGSDYGESIIGQKFAYIRDLQEIENGLDEISSSYSRLVEISYGHVQVGNGTPFPENYGNQTSSETAYNQLVLRHADQDGTTHYLLMNGERGNAITRGEGHEQVDQMQILYYVDKPGKLEHSYLMDAGYDQGGARNNSELTTF